MSRDTPKREPRKPWTALRAANWAVWGTLAVVCLTFCVSVQPARINARHDQAKNQASNLALAVTNYYVTAGRMPPHADGPRDPPVSWMTAILPQVDQRELYESVDFARPFDAPANAAAFGTRVRTYVSPDHDDDVLSNGLRPAHWAGNAPLFGRDATLDDVPDGVSQTLWIGEVNALAGAPAAWGDPANLRTAAAEIDSPAGFGGNFEGKLIAAFADGRAEFLQRDVDPAVFAALGTPDGGETVDPSDW